MRYKVIEESVSGNCCFESSVIDTTHPRWGAFYTICECFTLENATLICGALNRNEIAKVAAKSVLSTLDGETD